MTDAIRVQDLSFHYGRHSVLSKLNFAIEAGEIIGLIGENGAGKTTLLKLMQAQLPITGKISIFDHQAQDLCIRDWLGVMPQGDLRLPGVTVCELLENLSVSYSHPADIDQLIRINGMSTLRHQRLDRLSGGQLRRVTFLSALVGRPRLLFLDEPTVGMDVTARDRLWSQVKSMQSAGVTVIITSHDLVALQDVANRFLILQSGRIEFQGSFSALQAQHVQTSFRFNSSLPEDLLRQLPAVGSLARAGGDWLLTSTDGDQTMAALSHQLSQIHNLTVTKQSLADIFSEIVTREEKK